MLKKVKNLRVSDRNEPASFRVYPFGDDDLENDNVHYLDDLLEPLEDTINAARAIEPIFSLIEM